MENNKNYYFIKVRYGIDTDAIVSTVFDVAKSLNPREAYEQAMALCKKQMKTNITLKVEAFYKVD